MAVNPKEPGLGGAGLYERASAEVADNLGFETAPLGVGQDTPDSLTANEAPAYDPGAVMDQAGYNPGAAMDQAAAKEAPTAPTKERWEFFGVEQDRPFTEDEIERLRTQAIAGVYRKHGLTAEADTTLANYQQRLASRNQIAASDMALQAARDERAFQSEVKDLGGNAVNARQQAAEVQRAGGVDAYVGGLRKTFDAEAKGKGLAPMSDAQHQAVLNHYRKEFGPDVGYRYAGRLADAYERRGKLKEAEALRQEADTRAAVDTYGALMRNDFETATALYNAFPNGHQLKGIESVRGPNGEMEGVRLFNADGSTVKSRRGDGQVSDVHSMDQIENWLFGRVDPKHAVDLIKLDRSGDNRLAGLEQRLSAKIAGLGGGQRASARATGAGKPEKEADMFGQFKNFKELVGDADATPENWQKTLTLGGANPALTRSVEGRTQLANVAVLANRGELAPPTPALDPETLTWRRAYTGGKLGDMKVFHDGAAGVDPLKVGGIDAAGVAAMEDQVAQAQGLGGPDHVAASEKLYQQNVGLKAVIADPQAAPERRQEAQGLLTRNERLLVMGSNAYGRQRARSAKPDKPAAEAADQSLSLTENFGRLPYLEEQARLGKINAREQAELDALRGRKQTHGLGLGNFLSRLKGRADASASQMVP